MLSLQSTIDLGSYFASQIMLAIELKTGLCTPSFSYDK